MSKHTRVSLARPVQVLYICVTAFVALTGLAGFIFLLIVGLPYVALAVLAAVAVFVVKMSMLALLTIRKGSATFGKDGQKGGVSTGDVAQRRFNEHVEKAAPRKKARRADRPE